MGIDLNPSLRSVYTLRRLANQNTLLSYCHPKAENDFSQNRAFFDLKLAITQKICKIGIQKYAFLKSA